MWPCSNYCPCQCWRWYQWRPNRYESNFPGFEYHDFLLITYCLSSRAGGASTSGGNSRTCMKDKKRRSCYYYLEFQCLAFVGLLNKVSWTSNSIWGEVCEVLHAAFSFFFFCIVLCWKVVTWKFFYLFFLRKYTFSPYILYFFFWSIHFVFNTFSP